MSEIGEAESSGRVSAVVVRGVEGRMITLDAHHEGGRTAFGWSGQPDDGMAEARDRIRAALINSHLSWPTGSTRVSITPTQPRPVGSSLDLALACVLLQATGQLSRRRLDDVVLLGELALDGTLRAVRDVLPSLIAARRAGLRRAVVPQANLAEAHLVEDITVHGARNLTEAIGHLMTSTAAGPQPVQRVPAAGDSTSTAAPDLADVLVHDDLTYAMEIAAAGGHNLLLVAPDGDGRTILPARLAGLLPPLSPQDALSLAALRSAADRLNVTAGLSTTPPLVAPHRSASLAELIGGGGNRPRPGAVSLADQGVLFLDDATSWDTALLDTICTVLDAGEVRLARHDGAVTYPARFQLVLGTAPCDCGAAQDRDCGCSDAARLRHLRHLRCLRSPLMDRVDLRVRMGSASTSAAWRARAEDAAAVRARVQRARQAAEERWRKRGHRTNAEAAGTGSQMPTRLGLPARAGRSLTRALQLGQITARAATRTIGVAWTLADLSGLDRPDAQLVEQALELRGLTAAAATARTSTP